MSHVNQLMQNQYFVIILTFGLEQLVIVTRGVFIPQAMMPTLLANIHVTIGLIVYGNNVLINQPIRVNSYSQPGGKFLGGLLNGRLLGRGSPNWDPFKRLPPNPLVGFMEANTWSKDIYATMVLTSFNSIWTNQ